MLNEASEVTCPRSQLVALGFEPGMQGCELLAWGVSTAVPSSRNSCQPPLLQPLPGCWTPSPGQVRAQGAQLLLVGVAAQERRLRDRRGPVETVAAVMWFLRGPGGNSLGTVPASCGSVTPSEPSRGLVQVLGVRARAGSPAGTVSVPGALPLVLFYRKRTSGKARDSGASGPTRRQGCPSVHSCRLSRFLHFP